MVTLLDPISAISIQSDVLPLPTAGHFTQVVWKSSREAGFGKAKTKDGKCFVVGSYRPAGNLIGSFVENVPQRKDGKVPTKAELTGGNAAGKC